MCIVLEIWLISSRNNSGRCTVDVSMWKTYNCLDRSVVRYLSALYFLSIYIFMNGQNLDSISLNRKVVLMPYTTNPNRYSDVMCKLA